MIDRSFYDRLEVADYDISRHDQILRHGTGLKIRFDSVTHYSLSDMYCVYGDVQADSGSERW